MSEQKRSTGAVLRELGFSERYSHYAFRSRTLSYDTGILVDGDHATDCATLFYACEDGMRGFFYPSSLLELLLTDYNDEAYILRLVKRISIRCHTRLSLVSVYGTPMIHAPIKDMDLEAFDARSVRYSFSAMLKMIGQLDYLLPPRYDKLSAGRDPVDF